MNLISESTNHLDVKVKQLFKKLALTSLLSGSILASCKPVENYNKPIENYSIPPGTSIINVPSSRNSPGYESSLVQIITEPEGAAISVNNEYIGDSPIQVLVNQGYGYTAAECVPEYIEIKATPKGANAANLYERRVNFGGVNFSRNSGPPKLPKKIFLNLRDNRPKPDAVFENRQG